MAPQVPAGGGQQGQPGGEPEPPAQPEPPVQPEPPAQPAGNGGNAGNGDNAGDGDNGGNDSGETTIRDAVVQGAVHVIAAFFTAAGFLTFVAFTGSAITWVRFQYAGIPADQAISHVPRNELVASGATSLILYTVLGVLALGAIVGIDPPGDGDTRLMPRGLLVLVTVETWVAIALAGDAWLPDKAVAMGVIAAVCIGGLFASYYPRNEAERQRNAWAVNRQKNIQGLFQKVFRLGMFVDDPEADKPGVALSGLIAACITGVLCFTFLLLLMDNSVAWGFLAAAVLGVLAFGVCTATTNHYWLYCLAVFFSVALFGSLLSIIRLLDGPRISPVAVARTTDPPNQGTVGLYVASGDDGVWYATVAARCKNGRASNRPQEATGRLFHIPKDQVADSAVGAHAPLSEVNADAKALLLDLLATRPPATPQSPAATPATPPRPIGEPPAVRTACTCRDPKLTAVDPQPAAAGDRAEVTGTGFGDHGVLRLDGKPLVTARWTPTSILFQAPAGTTGGQLTVECGGSTSPPLRFIVAQNSRPLASGFGQPIGGRRYLLNGSDSTDPDGQVLTYAWRRGRKRIRGGELSVYQLRKNERQATVRLIVTDSQHASDTVAIRLRRVIRATIPAPALFAFDSDQLTPLARQHLAPLRRSVNGARSLYVAGYTDSRGPAAYNRDLSLRRALRVQTFLLSGVKHHPRAVLPPGAFGASHPVASSRTAHGRAKNRRVVVVIRR